MRQLIPHLTAAIGTLLTINQAQAAITYIDAIGGNGGNTVNAADASTTNWIGPDNTTDNLWTQRTRGPAAVLSATTGYQANLTEDAPMLVTVALGLVPGDYEIYVYYGSQIGTGTSNWRIRAGLSGGSLNLFDNTGLQVDASGNPTNQTLTGNRRYQGYVGTTTVGVDGLLQVYVDDTFVAGTQPEPRSIYDGIGYQLIPEPATTGLLAFAMGGLFLRRRR